MTPGEPGRPVRAGRGRDTDRAPVTEAPKAPDRRVRRTRRRLKEAILDLIERQDYDSITIQDLTEYADVGRSTFYSHYDSKEDLLFDGFDAWLLSLAEIAEPEGSGPPSSGVPPEPTRFRFSLPLIRHIRTQKHFFRATIARGSNARVRRRFEELFAELVRRELERIEGASGSTPPTAKGKTPTGTSAGGSATRRTGTNWIRDPEADRVREQAADRSRDARAHAIVGAFLSLVSWWLDRAPSLGAEEVDRIFQEVVAPGRDS